MVRDTSAIVHEGESAGEGEAAMFLSLVWVEHSWDNFDAVVMEGEVVEEWRQVTERGEEW